MGNGSVLKAEQALELGSAVLQHLPVDISLKDYEYWISHKSELGKVLRNGLVRSAQPLIRSVLAGKALKDLSRPEFWAEMWKFLNWEFNPKGLLVPAEQRGYGWLIGMPRGMTDNKSFNLNADSFNCWRWTGDLDTAIVHNDRDSKNGAYFIRVRNRIEADKELKGLSAATLWSRQIQGITHAEREVLEQAVWRVSGKHLDIESVTLCHGSRRSDSHVPHVRWNNDKLCVDWSLPDRTYDGLRGRVAVS